MKSRRWSSDTRRRSFREGDNITNIIGAGQQHGQTVQTKRQPACGGVPYQRVNPTGSRTSAPSLPLIPRECRRFAVPHRCEYAPNRRPLHSAVNHHIVSVSDASFRRSFQFRTPSCHAGGERMVHRGRPPSPSSSSNTEVNHPQRRPFVFVGQACGLRPVSPQRPAHQQPLFVICAEEDHVAVLRAGTFKDSVDDVGGRTLPPTANPVQTFRAPDIRQPRAADLKQSYHNRRSAYGCCGAAVPRSAATRPGSLAGPAKTANSTGFQQVSIIYQFHRVTQVWLVGNRSDVPLPANVMTGKSPDPRLSLPATKWRTSASITAHLWRGHEGGLDVDLSKTPADGQHVSLHHGSI